MKKGSIIPLKKIDLIAQSDSDEESVFAAFVVGETNDGRRIYMNTVLVKLNESTTTT